MIWKPTKPLVESSSA